MALRDSVWFPQSRDHAKVLTATIAMVVLHHSELLGLMDAGIVFGWMPVQFAYDIVYLLLGVSILYWMSTLMPDVPSEHISTTRTKESASVETTDTTEE